MSKHETEMEMEETEIEIKVPSLADALEAPWSYTVTRGPMGWTLCEIGEEVSLLIRRADAFRFLAEMEAHDDEVRDEQDRLDEECGG